MLLHGSLLSISMERDTLENPTWPTCFVVFIKAFFLSFVSTFWSFSLSLSFCVCRSSSPSCSGIRGVHQSERLRHSQLVSPSVHPAPRTSHVSIWTSSLYQLLAVICVRLDLRHSTIHFHAVYYSKRGLPLLFEIVHLPLFFPRQF